MNNQTESITDAVARHLYNKNSELVAKNVHYIRGSNGASLEADILRITKSGYAQEYEVKVSKQDFLKDSKKKISFHPETYSKHEALVRKLLPINQFYYVMPDELSCELFNDIPPFAGLIQMNWTEQWGGCYSLEIRKDAPRLGANKVSLEFKYEIAKKFYWRYWQ